MNKKYYKKMDIKKLENKDFQAWSLYYKLLEFYGYTNSKEDVINLNNNVQKESRKIKAILDKRKKQEGCAFVKYKNRRNLQSK